MRIRTLSVTEVTQYLKRIVSNDPILSHVSIEGEISNLKLHSSGHMYFTLKDDLARIQCVLFHGDASGVKFRPEDGQRVVVKGNISIYEKEGRYQIYVKTMEMAGIGDLFMKFEALKAKLDTMGYFRVDKKKPIPKYVTRIGVVASSDSAAWRDVKAVLTRRCRLVEVYLCPAAVQGIGASTQLALALKTLDSLELDVIMLTRGGGSIEELWAFNEEVLAKAIFEAKTPVITGIGHETDFTIADFVADLRAPTPSAAAEMAVVDHAVLINQLTTMMQSITVNSSRYIVNATERLKRHSPDKLEKSLNEHIKSSRMEAADLIDKSERDIMKRLTSQKHLLDMAGHQLNGLSPLGLLSKGYGIVENSNGLRIKSCIDASPGDTIAVRIEDGRLVCKVETIERSSLDES